MARRFAVPDEWLETRLKGLPFTLTSAQLNALKDIRADLDSGKPIVATRLPTHTQVLDDEVAVLVAPDPASFGEGLASLLADPGRAARIGAAGRARARAEYTPEAFRRKVLAFYDAVARSLHAA